MKKMNKKGFTIVELVIVIAVIAILAAVLIPTFGGMIDRANASNALNKAKNAHTSILYSLPATEVDDPFDAYIVVVDDGDTYYVHATQSGVEGSAVTDKPSAFVYEGANATYAVKSGINDLPDGVTVYFKIEE